MRGQSRCGRVQRRELVDRVDHLSVDTPGLVVRELRGWRVASRPHARVKTPLQIRGKRPGRRVGGRLSRAEDRHAGVVVDRVQQRVVVTPEGQTRDVTGPPNRAPGLEVDVEHDRRGVLGGEIVDQRGVVGARERKRIEIVVRLVVDRDDHDVLGRVLRAADREAPVDRAALERAQQACGVQRDADRRGSDCHQRQQQQAQPPVAGRSNSPPAPHVTSPLQSPPLVPDPPTAPRPSRVGWLGPVYAQTAGPTRGRVGRRRPPGWCPNARDVSAGGPISDGPRCNRLDLLVRSPLSRFRVQCVSAAAS